MSRSERPKSKMEEAKEELICPICTDFFVNPRSLHCLHSFCEACLIQLQRAGTLGRPNILVCPECRGKTTLPPSGVSGLPRNFKLSRFVEILSPDEKCEIKRVTTRRQSIRPTLPKCLIHNNKVLEYYCEHCRALICGQCMLDEHRMHGEVTYADKVLPAHIEALSSLIAPTNQVMMQAGNVLSSLKVDTETVRKQGEDNVKWLHAYFSRIRQILAIREEELVDSIQKDVDEKVELVARKQKMLLEGLDTLRECVQTVQDITANRSTDVEVLLEEDALRAKLSSHTKAIGIETNDSVDVPSVHCPLVENPDFEHLCRSLGGIGVPTPPVPPRRQGKSAPLTPSRTRLVQLSHRDSVESTCTEYTEVFTHEWEDNLRSDSITSIEITGTPPPTPPMRRESHQHKVVILEPVLEIGPKNLTGSMFRGMMQDVSPCGVCIANNNTIIVTDIQNHCFRILASTGRCLDVIGTEGKGDGQFAEPTAVAADIDGNILVSDKGCPRVQKFSDSGKFLSKFSTRSFRSSYLGEPWGIAVSFDGKILVSDWEKSCIHIYDENGKYHGNFGPSSMQAALKYPAGIGIDKRGRIVVADRGNHCVWIYTPKGDLLGRFGEQGHAPGELFYPFGIAVDKEGNIIVSESGNHRISVFTYNGKFVRCFGKRGSEPGMFQYPRHICLDKQGRLIVADELNQRLQIFSMNV